MKKRAMTTDKARAVRQRGHADAKVFARLVGTNYENDPQAKKDVIDHNGDAHSVKSGQKKWQIFLYRKKRFNDYEFKKMNGIGELLQKCVDVFPEDRADYLRSKVLYKRQLMQHMIAIKEGLKNVDNLNAFIYKSLFNGGEVQYLTIKQNTHFLVFWWEDVVEAFEQVELDNSKARREGETDAQKVLFRYKGASIGEIEMRNDSDTHYREVKFWLSKPKTIQLLRHTIQKFQPYKNKAGEELPIVCYGKAIKRFKP